MSAWDAGYDHAGGGGGGVALADQHAGLAGAGGGWDSSAGYGHESGLVAAGDDAYGGGDAGLDGYGGASGGHHDGYGDVGAGGHPELPGGWEGDQYGGEGGQGYGHERDALGTHGPSGTGGWEGAGYDRHGALDHYGGGEHGRYGDDHIGASAHDLGGYDDHGAYGHEGAGGLDHYGQGAGGHGLDGHGDGYDEFGAHHGDFDQRGQHGLDGGGYDLDGGLDAHGIHQGGYGHDHLGTGATPRASAWDTGYSDGHGHGLDDHHLLQSEPGADGWEDDDQGLGASQYDGAGAWDDHQRGLTSGYDDHGEYGLDGHDHSKLHDEYGAAGVGAHGDCADQIGSSFDRYATGSYDDHALRGDRGYGSSLGHSGYDHSALGLEGELASLSLGTEHHHHHHQHHGDAYGDQLGLIEGGSRMYGSNGLGGLHGGSGWGGLDGEYDNAYCGALKPLYVDTHGIDLFGGAGHGTTGIYNDPFANPLPLDYGHGQIAGLSQYGLSKNSWTANDVLALDDMYLFESALQADMELNESERLRLWQERLRWEELDEAHRRIEWLNMSEDRRTRLGLGTGGFWAARFGASRIDPSYGYRRYLVGNNGILGRTGLQRGIRHYPLSSGLYSRFPRGLWERGGVGLGRSLLSWLHTPSYGQHHHGDRRRQLLLEQQRRLNSNRRMDMLDHQRHMNDRRINLDHQRRRNDMLHHNRQEQMLSTARISSAESELQRARLASAQASRARLAATQATRAAQRRHHAMLSSPHPPMAASGPITTLSSSALSSLRPGLSHTVSMPSLRRPLPPRRPHIPQGSYSLSGQRLGPGHFPGRVATGSLPRGLSASGLGRGLTTRHPAGAGMVSRSLPSRLGGRPMGRPMGGVGVGAMGGRLHAGMPIGGRQVMAHHIRPGLAPHQHHSGGLPPSRIGARAMPPPRSGPGIGVGRGDPMGGRPGWGAPPPGFRPGLPSRPSMGSGRVMHGQSLDGHGLHPSTPGLHRPAMGVRDLSGGAGIGRPPIRSATPYHKAPPPYGSVVGGGSSARPPISLNDRARAALQAHRTANSSSHVGLPAPPRPPITPSGLLGTSRSASALLRPTPLTTVGARSPALSRSKTPLASPAMSRARTPVFARARTPVSADALARARSASVASKRDGMLGVTLPARAPSPAHSLRAKSPGAASMRAPSPSPSIRK